MNPQKTFIRKRIRIEGYDYSTPGAYFITFCVKGRQTILWKNFDPQHPHIHGNALSSIGMIIDNEIRKIEHIYSHITIDKYCIMPDHIHMIIFISSKDTEATESAPTISRVIQQFKGSTTKQIGKSIWQKSFIDRVIRNEDGYRKVWEYIDNNPIKLDFAYDNIDFTEM